MQPQDEHFQIIRLEPEKLGVCLPGILRVYRDSWIATYQSDDLGISKEDLENNFESTGALEEEWLVKLQTPERQTWLLLEGSQNIVGFCVARKADDIHELEYLYLLPSAQGKGSGARLMQQAMDWLGSDKPIVLFGARHNTKAIEFYEKFGFKLSADFVPPKVLSNGKEIPAMKMVRA